MLYDFWVKHNLRPGEFYRLPRGEQLFLLASQEIEIESARRGKRGGSVSHAKL